MAGVTEGDLPGALIVHDFLPLLTQEMYESWPYPGLYSKPYLAKQPVSSVLVSQ